MPDDDHQPADDGDGTEVSWRVNSRLTALKIGGTVLFLLAAVAFLGDPAGLVVSLLAAAALAAFALRDVLAPVRLAADPSGITVVTGFNGRRHVPWDKIERVRVDERTRLGMRSQLLEIDTGDTLHLFSGSELSASCEDVARRLTALSERS
jgi:hypothetical protein